MWRDRATRRPPATVGRSIRRMGSFVSTRARIVDLTDIHDWHETDLLHAEQGQGDPFAAAVRATRMAMIITDPRKPDNPIVFANAAFLKLTGYTREEVVGSNCRFLQGKGDGPEVRGGDPRGGRKPLRHRDRYLELPQERRAVLERPLHVAGHQRRRRIAILLRIPARRHRSRLGAAIDHDAAGMARARGLASHGRAA